MSFNDPGSPIIDPTFYVYNSYVSDPPYQVIFTIVWTVGAAACVLIGLPKLIRAIRTGRAWQGWMIWEDVYGQAYTPLKSPERIVPRPIYNVSRAWWSAIEKNLAWRLPYVNLDLGQLIILVGYLGTLMICIFYKSPIVESPNRAGFLALAQLPAVFIFATKNSILGALLGKGYEKLNFLHRWAGRFLFLAATIHGSLWIHNNQVSGVVLVGSQKVNLGIAAYTTLVIIVVSSLPIVRRAAYQVFFIVHVLGYVSFFVVVCYHTLYAVPWIFPPLAFFGFDLLLRMMRARIKDAVLIPIDNQMTLIHVQHCDGGWVAGQHIRLRIFFSGRMFESHPLTILNAPAPISCTSSGELILGARVCGDWTRALNNMALTAEKLRRVNVMIDGPYGGSTVEIGEYESVLLVAGGSGVTFTLSLLDDIIGRIVNMKRRGGERTSRVEFAWCIRSFGNIQWISSILQDIATKAQDSSVDLHIKIFVTCLCDPEAVPTIPNCEVTMEKPKIASLIKPLLVSPVDPEIGKVSGRGNGGLAVVVSGPARLTREAQNVVAGIPGSHVRRIGGLALHTEIFSL